MDESLHRGLGYKASGAIAHLYHLDINKYLFTSAST